MNNYFLTDQGYFWRIVIFPGFNMTDLYFAAEMRMSKYRKGSIPN